MTHVPLRHLASQHGAEASLVVVTFNSPRHIHMAWGFISVATKFHCSQAIGSFLFSILLIALPPILLKNPSTSLRYDGTWKAGKWHGPAKLLKTQHKSIPMMGASCPMLVCFSFCPSAPLVLCFSRSTRQLNAWIDDRVHESRIKI